SDVCSSDLVGDRPARFTGAEAQLALLGNGVDLEHHAVDLVGQVVPAGANVGVVVAAFVHAVGQLQLAADGQAPALERMQDVDVATGQLALAAPHAVGTELQRAAGGDSRVQLAQAAGGGVARVGEGLAARFQLAGIEGLEAGLGHVDLAAHLQHRRPALAVQLQRNVAHGAHVGADVLADTAVTTGGAAHQHAVLV